MTYIQQHYIFNYEKSKDQRRQCAYLPLFVKYHPRILIIDDYIRSLPSTIKIIKFGNCFNNNVDNLLEEIVFGTKFNSTVNHLPHSIKRLTFDTLFNQAVDNLPNLLEEIVFGSKSGQSTQVVAKNNIWIQI